MNIDTTKNKGLLSYAKCKVRLDLGASLLGQSTYWICTPKLMMVGCFSVVKNKAIVIKINMINKLCIWNLNSAQQISKIKFTVLSNYLLTGGSCLEFLAKEVFVGAGMLM